MSIDQIQLRRGTTAAWTAANPVLAEGELGLDTTLNAFRIGDGITAWLSLPWALARATDGTYTHPILPTTSGTLSTTDATPTAFDTTITLTNNKYQRIGVQVFGLDTTNHKVIVSEAQILVKSVSSASTVLATLTAPNPTTGVSPAYDGIGVAADVSYGVSYPNLTITATGKAATNIGWTFRAWVITEGAI